MNSNNKYIIPDRMNRIKAILAEKGLSNNWLADRLSKNINTISRWCNNKQQPHLKDLYEIANILMIDVTTLLTPNLNEEA